MNPRLGICLLLACAGASLLFAGCHSTVTPTSSPIPVPSASGPDTLYVQSNGQVRIYQHAANLNGVIAPAAVLPASDASNPDVVYSPQYNVLWYPSAYPAQVPGRTYNTPIKIWTNPIGQNNMNPTYSVPYTNGQGTATYDPNHDLLYVANVNGPTIQVYANAHAMNSTSTPAANITLVINDPLNPGTPRPAEMLYDPVNDRLFVTDQGSVCAEFDNFGSTAAGAVSSGSNPTLTASREIGGLYQPWGIAYSAANDVLFLGERSPTEVAVIHNASTLSGIVAHTQTITGFSSVQGLTYDGVRDLLFIYDPIVIWVVPAPEVAKGPVNNILNRRQLVDATVELTGFGITVDTTH